jgi:hypothetical protein
MVMAANDWPRRRDVVAVGGCIVMAEVPGIASIHHRCAGRGIGGSSLTLGGRHSYFITYFDIVVKRLFDLKSLIFMKRLQIETFSTGYTRSEVLSISKSEENNQEVDKE